MTRVLVSDEKYACNSANSKLNQHYGNTAVQRWLDKVAIVPATQPLLPPQVKRAVHDNVTQGLLSERQLDIEYTSPGGKQAKSATVHPLGLVQHGVVHYLVATFFEYGDLSGPLIRALLAARPEDLKALGEDLSHDRPNPRKIALGADQIIAKLTNHLACLPNPAAGLQIRFSRKHPRAVSPEMLVPLGDRLVVGAAKDRIGVHPIYQVVDMRCIDNARTTGRWTVATRVLVAAILSFIDFQRRSKQ